MVAQHDHGTQSATEGFSNPLVSVSSAFDVGVVRFPNIAKNFGVSPARFGLSRDTQVGDKIKVVGYGDDGTTTSANPSVEGNPRGTELVVEQVAEGYVATLFDTTKSGACHGDSGGAATFNGLIVASVYGGGDPETGVSTCAAGSVALFADLQTKGNVDFIRQNAPGALFE